MLEFLDEGGKENSNKNNQIYIETGNTKNSVSGILDGEKYSSEILIFQNQIFEKLENGNINGISKIIMEMLTTRPEFLNEKYSNNKINDNFLLNLGDRVKTQSDYYNEVLQKIEEQNLEDGILQVADNPAWFSLKTKNHKEVKDQINYKIYLTIPVENYDFLSKIYKLGLLFDEISKNTGDKISLKVPKNILGFLSHNDSLVIHFKDISNKQLIEQTLEKWKKDYDVPEQERYLSRTKFAGDSKEKSFSQLISENIENWILENYQKYDNKKISTLAISYAINQASKPPNFII